jgi:general secretion pathway protein F
MMPVFKYRAKEGPEKNVSGVIESKDLDNAVQHIIRLGLTPVDVHQEAHKQKDTGGSAGPCFQFRRPISLSHIAAFTRQISDLLDASVPMLRALEIVSRQTREPRLKNIVSQLSDLVKDGSSFSGALERSPEVFSSFYIHMVRAGELGGRLEKILGRLADSLEKMDEIQGKVRAGLAYPLLVLAVGGITIFVLLTFIIPRLAVMFYDLDQALPLPTVVLMGVSSFFARFWWMLMALAGAGAVYGGQWARSPHGRARLDGIKLRIPFLRNFITIVEVGRFARTAGTLLESGVTITDTLNAVRLTVDNTVFREDIERISLEVQGGSTLKAALGKSLVVPDMAANMIAVGEEAGQLDRGLYKIADTFERQSDQAVKAMLSLLGPVVLIVIVSIVGFAVIAMLLPILQMNLLIQ